MKIKEARDYLNKLNPRYDDNELVIPTQGLCCDRIKVTGFGLGFDWFNGNLCVYGDPEPSQVDLNEYSKLRQLYLKQKTISNLKDVNDGETKTARYKKVFKECENKWSARLWISEQLDKELKLNE